MRGSALTWAVVRSMSACENIFSWKLAPDYLFRVNLAIRVVQRDTPYRDAGVKRRAFIAEVFDVPRHAERFSDIFREEDGIADDFSLIGIVAHAHYEDLAHGDPFSF